MKDSRTKIETKLERDPDLAHFEAFLKIIGFKRTDGAIYGLLVLSPEPLSSQNIGKTLGLSQGAVSQGLKNLSHWGAVKSQYSPAARAQLHTATQDSLSIVANIFQKREMGAIEAFRRVNENARDRFLREGAAPDSLRIARLNSNITTCEFAQVVMEFAVGLTRPGVLQSQYTKLIKALPKVLTAVASGPKTLSGLRQQVTSRLKEHSPWA